MQVPTAVLLRRPARDGETEVQHLGRGYGDWLNVLLTHPTAIFIADVKVAPTQTGREEGRYEEPGDKKPDKQPDEKAAEAGTSPDVEIQAGMVVSLGPDAARLHAKFIKYLRRPRRPGRTALQTNQDRRQDLVSQQADQAGRQEPRDLRLPRQVFRRRRGPGRGGRHPGPLEQPPPAWLAKALEQTQVPRRTGIVYLNLKALRDKLLPLAPSQKDAVAVLELLGLDNVDSLVSTTGLEDYGMINRVLLALDGKPRGLLDMVADRPLAAKDLEPIPSDALLALAARVDLDRTLKVVMAAYEKAGRGGRRRRCRRRVEEFKKEYGVDVHRFLSALGDTWCVYNSPAEGEMAFLGWTAVVPVRDRAALLDSWEKLCAAQEKKEAKKEMPRTKAKTATRVA